MDTFRLFSAAHFTDCFQVRNFDVSDPLLFLEWEERFNTTTVHILLKKNKTPTANEYQNIKTRAMGLLNGIDLLFLYLNT